MNQRAYDEIVAWVGELIRPNKKADEWDSLKRNRWTDIESIQSGSSGRK